MLIEAEKNTAVSTFRILPAQIPPNKLMQLRGLYSVTLVGETTLRNGTTRSRSSCFVMHNYC